MAEHYFTQKQHSKFIISKISAHLRNHNFEFLTASGVFSKKRIDPGTNLLINKSLIKPGKILDLGCGYGPVGIAIAKTHPKSDITMSDINERAILLTKKNIKLNNIKNAKAIKSNLFEKIKSKFDIILLNPPQTAGKKLCFQMIEESYSHLKPNGTFQLVARHNKGGKTLSEKMKLVFGNLKTIAKKSGYRIYFSKKD